MTTLSPTLAGPAALPAAPASYAATPRGSGPDAGAPGSAFGTVFAEDGADKPPGVPAPPPGSEQAASTRDTGDEGPDGAGLEAGPVQAPPIAAATAGTDAVPRGAAVPQEPGLRTPQGSPDADKAALPTDRVVEPAVPGAAAMSAGPSDADQRAGQPAAPHAPVSAVARDTTGTAPVQPLPGSDGAAVPVSGPAPATDGSRAAVSGPDAALASGAGGGSVNPGAPATRPPEPPSAVPRRPDATSPPVPSAPTGIPAPSAAAASATVAAAPVAGPQPVPASLPAADAATAALPSSYPAEGEIAPTPSVTRATASAPALSVPVSPVAAPSPLLGTAQVALTARARFDAAMSDADFRRIADAAGGRDTLAEAGDGSLAPDRAAPSVRGGFGAELLARTDPGPSLAQQLAAAIQRNGSGQYDVALNPPELGRVRIAMEAIDGVMHVTITAERGDTSDLMRRHIEQLERSLRDVGYDQLAFAFGDPGTGAGHPVPTDDPDFRGAGGPAMSGPEQAVPAVAHPPQMPGLGGLDVRL